MENAVAGLGETTAMLARARRQAATASAVTSTAEGRLASINFSPNPGQLRMLSYAPANLARGAPLVVTLHGCTQSAAAYAAGAGWLTLADQYRFAVVAPEQVASNNPNRCFNWFQPQDIARGQGEAASIRAMVTKALEVHGCDPERVFVTGLSAGGAMTSVMLAAYPEVFAGGAIISGLPYGVADTTQAALAAMFSGQTRSAEALGELVRKAAPASPRRPRVSIWHGDADATVKPSNAGESTKQWTAVHGVAGRAPTVESFGRRTRSVWRSDAGESVVEAHIIQGLGHGTPLAAAGPSGLGATGPFMLEAGVSSSLEIARFWTIAEPAPASADERRDRSQHRPAEPDPVPSVLADRVLAAVSRHVPQDIQTVIAKALRAAGLGG